ncbi:MAG TPA: cyclic-di-AMP receptor [Bacillota bacterium]
MKLVVAVVQDKDAARLLESLVEKGFRATKLASTGGFLKEGNTTLLLGVDDPQIDEVAGIIKRVCQSREQLVTPLTPVGGPVDSYVPYPVEVLVGGAAIFVLNVERFEKV